MSITHRRDGLTEYTLTVAIDCAVAPTDEELVERCRHGSEAAFATIVERYRAALTRHCSRIVDHCAAEDAVQEALVSAWASLHAGTDVQQLRPWLFTIARRKALTTRSREHNTVELPETLAASRSSADEADLAAQAQATLAAVAELPEAQREALLRSALFGHNGAQIAHTLDVPEPVVRQLVFRARASVRAAAAACIAPPLTLVRLLRRAIGATGRTGGLAGKLTVPGTLLKAGALVTITTVVAATAAHDSAPRPRTPQALLGVALLPHALPAMSPARATHVFGGRSSLGSPVHRPRRSVASVRPHDPLLARTRQRADADVPPRSATPGSTSAAKPATGASRPVAAAERGGTLPHRTSDGITAAPMAQPLSPISTELRGIVPPARVALPAVPTIVTQIIQATSPDLTVTPPAAGSAFQNTSPATVTQTTGTGPPSVDQQPGVPPTVTGAQAAITGATGAIGTR